MRGSDQIKAIIELLEALATKGMCATCSNQFTILYLYTNMYLYIHYHASSLQAGV